MIIRLASTDDAVAVAQLNEAFNAVQTTPECMAQRMAAAANIERIYLAEIDGMAVGFASLWIFPVACFPEPYAEVSELYVHMDYRRRGIGRALMKETIRVARTAGANELKLITAFQNTAAQQLYAELGFEKLALHLSLHLESPGISLQP